MSHDLSTPGRRTATGTGPRLSLPVVLAVALPLLTLLVLVPVSAPDVVQRPAGEPSSAPLGRADVACPRAVPGGRQVLVASAGDAEGEVTAHLLGRGEPTPQELPLAPGRPAETRLRGPVVVTGTQALAPGLMAVRAGADPLVATSCPAPGADQWFTGLGASGTHASTLELVNPDSGPAVVDIDLWSERGPVSAPQVRGVAVPARGVTRLDLSSQAPSRGPLAAHVVVTRGRVSATVQDTTDPVGSDPAVTQWIPAQSEATRSPLLPGVLPGDLHSLELANPGESEARVEVQLVGRGTFTPTAAKEIRVPAGASVSQGLGWLARELRRGPDTVALRLDSTEPVLASLRTESDGGRAVTASADPLTATGATPLPAAGRRALVLAGAEQAGAATITVHGSRGRVLSDEDVRLAPGTGTRIRLPRDAAYVRVDVRRTSIVAAVELTGPDGLAVLPLVEPATEGLVPEVRSVLP